MHKDVPAPRTIRPEGDAYDLISLPDLDDGESVQDEVPIAEPESGEERNEDIFFTDIETEVSDVEELAEV